VQVIIQRPALAQKLRREQQPRAAKPAHDALRIANRHRGLDDHECAGVDPADEREHRLDGRGVEEVALGVIVRRRGNDDHVGFGSDFDGISHPPYNIHGVQDYKPLIEYLQSKNYSDSTIEKITHKNVLNLLGKVL